MTTANARLNAKVVADQMAKMAEISRDIADMLDAKHPDAPGNVVATALIDMISTLIAVQATTPQHAIDGVVITADVIKKRVREIYFTKQRMKHGPPKADT